MISGGMKWLFLILGTMIGAGYASGRELWQFFGHESVLAIILFTVMFSICCYVIMKISYETKSTHYLPILERLVGKKLTGIYDLLIILYLFTTTIVMFAGGGATMEVVHLPYWLGICILAVLVIILFFWDINGMLSMNAIILPLLIILLLSVLGLFLHSNPSAMLFNWTKQANWPAAFTFTALNILPLVAVLSAVGHQIKHKGEIWIASLGSGLILGGVSFLYNQSLIQVAHDLLLYEIPLFAILKTYPYYMILIMSVLLWLAIYTTAVSGVFGLTSRFRDLLGLPLWIVAFIIVMIMLPFTAFGFSTLIAFLYPLYGVLNLYILASILIFPVLKRYDLLS
ncbi:YkvI family membrane protein [Guptibacillus hwajinpoensis]|uniref:YkvI family membrane protein n=1 Tax=Guptibacillus hwajinpoensis TaxID=208199 RepID=UPI001CFF2F85|nr:hypothetical protein [Pseudalkalibacillus hwajinpoensis]WLR57976.1 hypothetical protein LC071_11775 [Pseudalkalibacillus hwajinpoensis]